MSRRFSAWRLIAFTALMERTTGLDGLRGAAAVIVAFSHFLLLFPANRWTPLWKYSPAYVLTAGHEAVLIFFILSGFALDRMVRSGKPFHYGRYALRRTIRIYGPYLGALLLAVAGNLWLSQGPRNGFNEWVNRSWTLPVPVSAIWAHVAFLGNYDTDRFNGPFWSLVHEMRVSLIFPLLGRLRQSWAVACAVLMMVIGTLLNPVLGSPNNLAETLHYAGFFVVGIAISTHLPILHKPGRWMLAAAVVLFLYGRAIVLLIPKQYSNALDIPVGLGAAVIVIFAARSDFFAESWWQWLGQRSYSLYLIHVPVLLSLVNLLNLRRPAMWLLAIYLPAALVATELFYRFVEQPLLRWSRRAG